MIGYVAPSTFALTLVNLAVASARESILIDNRTVKYDDYEVTIGMGIATPTSASDQAMYVWLGACVDGTNWSSPCTGADAAITLGTHALKGPFVQPISVGTTIYYITIPSVALAFGGIMPPLFNIVVQNMANGAFSATEPIKYVRGVFYTT